MKNTLLLLFLFLGSFADAQSFEQFTAEDLPETGTIIKTLVDNDFIYYCGYALDGGKIQVYVRKVDTNGNLIWTTTQWEDDGYEDYVLYIYQLHLSEDGYLYANVGNYDDAELWKIDSNNGKIIYKHNQSDYITDSNPQLSAIRDFDDTRLLLAYNSYINSSDYEIHFAFFDKITGTLLQTQSIETMNGFDYTFDIVVDADKNVYYASTNRVTKLSPNLNSILWSTTLSNVEEALLRRLVLESDDNAIYGFGITGGSGAARGRVVRLNTETGNLQWYFEVSQLHLNYSDSKIADGNIYATWKLTFSVGDYAVVVTKINKTTGNGIWETQHKYSNGGYEEVANSLGLDANNDIYLTGAYSQSNASRNRWGIMKLQNNNGNLIYTNVLQEEDEPYQFNDASEGILIYPLADKTIILGNQAFAYFGKVETYLEINNTTGTILIEKYIGGLSTFDARTVEMKQFADGTVVVGQQIGTYSKIILQNDQGNVEWERLIGPGGNAGEVLTSVEIVNDSLVILSGKEYDYYDLFTANYDFFNNFFYLFNRNSRTIIHREYWQNSSWQNEDSRGIMDAFLDLSLDRFFFTGLYNNYMHIYTSYVSSTAVQAEFPVFVGDDYINTNNNVLVDHNTNSFLVLMYGGFNKFSKTAFDNNSEFIDYDGVGYLNHVEEYQNSFYLACGDNNDNKATFIKIQKSNLAEIWVDELPITGTALKWVLGENSDFIYFLTNNSFDSISVSKYNVNSKTLLWTTTLSESNLGNLFPTDIAFNKTGGYLTVTGYINDPISDNKMVMIYLVDADGNILSNLQRDGLQQGQNSGLALLSSSESSQTIIGGALHRNNTKTDAFLFYLNGTEVNNFAKCRAFWDANGNKQLDADEQGLSLGSITIDGLYHNYPDGAGNFNLFLEPGNHVASYNIPLNWSLTTDSTSYYFNTASPDYGVNTFLFGLIPTAEVGLVEPFVVSDILVCNTVINLYLNVENKGTTYEDVLVELDFDAEYLSSNFPYDSLNENIIQWTLDSLSPGNNHLIKLTMSAPNEDALGDSLQFDATVYLLDSNNQSLTDSFFYHYQDILLCAYDPNDKQVNPAGTGPDGNTPFGIPLNYTIRFQNTGNYFATDIVIRDTLDIDLDWSTFEVLASSHLLTEVTRKANAVAFVFNKIYLPDSISNEPESHGFVSFRISPKAGLAENTHINNTAYIYFDSNPAIVTNTTINNLVNSNSQGGGGNGDGKDKLTTYPNPGNGYIVVHGLSDTHSALNWRLWNSQGQLIENGILETGEKEINLKYLNIGVYFLEVENEGWAKIFIIE